MFDITTVNMLLAEASDKKRAWADRQTALSSLLKEYRASLKEVFYKPALQPEMNIVLLLANPDASLKLADIAYDAISDSKPSACVLALHLCSLFPMTEKPQYLEQRMDMILRRNSGLNSFCSIDDLARPLWKEARKQRENAEKSLHSGNSGQYHCDL